MNGKVIIGEDPLVRDFRIPRRDGKLAVLRLEYPITIEDVEQLRSWLDILRLIIPEEIPIPVKSKAATFELVAKDPIVTIRNADGSPVEPGPAEPGAPVSKGDKDVPPGATPHIPPPLPDPDKKRRKMKRAKSKPTDVTNSESVVKRICRDCGVKYPLEQFRAMGGLAVTYGPPRDRCRVCHAAYIKP